MIWTGNAALDVCLIQQVLDNYRERERERGTDGEGGTVRDGETEWQGERERERRRGRDGEGGKEVIKERMKGGKKR
mgnify:CR=1 FL=1